MRVSVLYSRFAIGLCVGSFVTLIIMQNEETKPKPKNMCTRRDITTYIQTLRSKLYMLAGKIPHKLGVDDACHRYTLIVSRVERTKLYVGHSLQAGAPRFRSR